MARIAEPSREPRSQCLVVGYDGSDWSEAAVRYAAQRLGAEGCMVVVHAYASPPDVVPDADRRRIVEERRVNGRELLASVLARCREVAADISCEIELVEGPSADALLAVASDRNAAEIVVGSRGTGRSWTPIGSVSRQLLSVADRPVVVVPVAKRDAM